MNQALKFGTFMAPFHDINDNPNLSLHRDLELIQWMDDLGYDEAWIGEHHSGGWEIIGSPEIFMGIAAERTKHIMLGTGVVSLPYHHPYMVAERMVLLDHLTRGRVMLGVGPGALTSDALMFGIEPQTQRPRMEEAMDIIFRLMTETEPITYEGEWFTLRNARLQLRPYTRPHMPIGVAAVQSPSGMRLAGKYGFGVLSLSLPRGANAETALKDFWGIAEETAKENGKTMRREDWRIVIHAHIAETKQRALDEARVQSVRYQRGYFQETLAHPSPFDGPDDELIDHMAGRKLWCVGNPDDLISRIHDIEKLSGGFGGIMIQATEWGTREQVRRSYELIARYVMPEFQGTLVNVRASQEAVASSKDDMRQQANNALAQATDAYQSREENKVSQA